MVDIHKLPDGTETYFCDFCEDNFSQKKVAETHQNECEHLLVQSNLTSDYLAFTNNSKLKLSDGFGGNGKQVRVEHINKISISKMYKHIIVNDNDETEKSIIAEYFQRCFDSETSDSILNLVEQA